MPPLAAGGEALGLGSPRGSQRTARRVKPELRANSSFTAKLPNGAIGLDNPSTAASARARGPRLGMKGDHAKPRQFPDNPLSQTAPHSSPYSRSSPPPPTLRPRPQTPPKRHALGSSRRAQLEYGIVSAQQGACRAPPAPKSKRPRHPGPVRRETGPRLSVGNTYADEISGLEGARPGPLPGLGDPGCWGETLVQLAPRAWDRVWMGI